MLHVLITTSNIFNQSTIEYISDFRKQWNIDPLQVEFKENETGNKSILVRPVEDNTVDGDQQYVLVTKRMSTDEGIARYYSHRIINVLDNDGIKTPQNYHS